MSRGILVVGAGPVGVSLAMGLRRYGVPVRVVEKALAPSGQSRALFLWTRTLELLDADNLGAALLAAGRRIEAVNVLAGSKRIGRVEFSEIDSTHPYALMLPQAETERILTEQLGRLGGRVEFGTELTNFINAPDCVTATLRHADGNEETFEADYLVGCDGGASFVRKQLGLSSSGPAQQSDWLLADVRLDGFASLPSELNSFWHEDGFLGIFPLPSGYYRVIADLHGILGERPETPELAQVQALVEQRGPGGITVSDPIWLSAFRIHERNTSSYRAGRMFLAGDAAHLHNPVGAQGLNMGIHDAVNLAWKLAMVHRGVANAETLLESYTAERHAVAEALVTNLDRAATVAMLKNPTVQIARNLLGNVFFGLKPARKAMAESVAEVSHSYPHSPLNGTEWVGIPGPAPGERLPPRPDEPPMGAGDSPRFALFAASSPAVRELQLQFAGLLEPHLRPQISPGTVWLGRPDGYVATVALEENIRQIEDYLRAYVSDSASLAVM
ncbi:FAD-dependent monooxygenase [Acidocella aromatica]|uniref:2-polyprenyl-6-methoxyphenol hydroxylase-like FAD-dependent oxidoreductase n=1 Tax=Acidocella aromatica TaxID=1303579 RepID=A0A840VF36_9PROT|nr:FAD-dependent monooxygenase [Acidocella aromatica]MBB5374394.1 2-polyprenyl-6-methoxyphenol hydroxylase-like FAD-dependent oxidoreductase [Acidocella aromatica]